MATALPSHAPQTWLRPLPALKAHKQLLAIGLASGAIGLAIGVFVTADGARRTGELRLDIWISAHRDGFAKALSSLIDVAFGPALAPLWIIGAAAIAWFGRERVAAIVIPLLAFPGWFSSGAGKILFHRLRPPTETVHALVHETAADSFPSGHTTFVAAFVCALAVAFHHRARIRTWVYAVGVPLVLVVAASRLVLGAHYLGDVVAAPFFAVGTILTLCAIASQVPKYLAARLENGQLLDTKRH